MRLVAHADAREFLSSANPLLARDEARHNLMYGITSALTRTPSVFSAFHLWTVERDGETVAALIVTSPHNLVVADPLDGDALPFAARELARADFRFPGVTGALPEADVFANAWVTVAGADCRVRMRQGIYAASEVNAPADVNGSMRSADQLDRELLVDWLQKFQVEALEDERPHEDLVDLVDRRIGGPGGFALWAVEGKTVSIAGYGGATPHGMRIGPVYTPPELRRRGYAGALVAGLTQDLLTRGLRQCFLYTDLSNPTANRVYMNVGYELVCESVMYAFD